LKKLKKSFHLERQPLLSIQHQNKLKKITNYAFIEEYEFKNKIVKLIRYSFENKEEAEEMEIDDKETFDQIIENNKFLIEEFRPSKNQFNESKTKS
jgi:hypothetical protein